MVSQPEMSRDPWLSEVFQVDASKAKLGDRGRLATERQPEDITAATAGDLARRSTR